MEPVQGEARSCGQALEASACHRVDFGGSWRAEDDVTGPILYFSTFALSMEKLSGDCIRGAFRRWDP